jgi:hypothetical protein
MDYGQNAQRNAITQALMNVQSPPPRPQMPQQPQVQPQQGMSADQYNSRAQALLGGGGNAEAQWAQQGRQQMPQVPQQMPPLTGPTMTPAPMPTVGGAGGMTAPMPNAGMPQAPQAPQFATQMPPSFDTSDQTQGFGL